MDNYQEDYRISQLIAKKWTTQLTPEEEDELSDWVRQYPDSYKLIQDETEKNERNTYVSQLDVDASWRSVRSRITARRKNKYTLPHLLKIAVSVLLLMTAGGSIAYLMQKKYSDIVLNESITTGASKAILITGNGQWITLQDSSVRTISIDQHTRIKNNGKKAEYLSSDTNGKQGAPTIYNTIIVPRGGEYELVLSDGTHVWLNSDSELRFPVSFGSGKRQIFLKGEAFFAVTKDKLHPFIVNACDKMEIEVLGTTFNIQAYPNEDNLYTTLNSGSIKISNCIQSFELRPNEQAVYDTKSRAITISTVNAECYSAWKEGMFIFENERLETIMNRLSRWYDVTVFYLNHESKNFHFTGDLEKYDDFETSLRMIEKASHIKFEINEKNVIVK